DRFKVLVVGEFKRGKSTLLNAMLGGDVMPRKAAECTAVVTTIQYHDQPHVKVIYADNPVPRDLSVEEFRRDFELKVDDAGGDRQAAADRFSNVIRAELYYPVELCRHRVELVDSPGIGAHRTRTERVTTFVHEADAVVFVLHAMQFLKEDEGQFLETKLLPLGLRNIFFVINWYNLIEEQLPGDRERDEAELEAAIRLRLTPFCNVGGIDRTDERVFRVNALAALRARLGPPDEAALERSRVPAFERSLERFLIEDRARARNDATLGLIRKSQDDVNTHVANQNALASKSIAEIEAERVALQPKLDRLRGIKRHIEDFLDTKSSLLRDGLAVSFHKHLERIDNGLDAAVEKFNLSNVLQFPIALQILLDWFNKGEDKFAARLERALKPQVTRHLEREFAVWQSSVVSNELRAVAIDVEKHLQEEAAEYRRVLTEIQDRLGTKGDALPIKEYVDRWLSGGDMGGEADGLQMPHVTSGILGDLSLVIASIVAEIMVHFLTNVMFAGIPFLGILIAGVRMGLQDKQIRRNINAEIAKGIRQSLRDLESSRTALIREEIRHDFDGLKRKVTSSIDDEIALIDGSIQAVLDRKREREQSAENERTRLDDARSRLTGIADRLRPLLAT
ncbi:hypothetical protein EBR04_03860, partial [bacterium]|nr:hypothetical protein [bacterium]